MRLTWAELAMLPANFFDPTASVETPAHAALPDVLEAESQSIWAITQEAMEAVRVRPSARTVTPTNPVASRDQTADQLAAEMIASAALARGA